jgi:holin-like protein
MAFQRCQVVFSQLLAIVKFAENKRAEFIRRTLFRWRYGNLYTASAAIDGVQIGTKPSVYQMAPHVFYAQTELSIANRHVIIRAVAIFQLVALQLFGLWMLNMAGIWVAEAVNLPIPGNLLGMIGLYALLSLGIVKVSWLDTTGSFLIKHLAFFFIPVTVGLMEAGDLLAAHGFGIVVTLIISAAIGILLSGFVAQCLARRLEQREEGR